MTKVYILLPVHNRRDITRAFVECLKVQSFRDFRLVLIDDGSTDGTADAVRCLLRDVTVLQGSGNLWWAGGLQMGLDWLKKQKVADSDLVLFINDDVAFGPDYLASAVSFLNDRPRLLLMSKFSCDNGKTIRGSGVVADLKSLSFRPAVSDEEANCFSTRGLFVRFGDIKVIGDFHPRVLPHYLSDYEYTIRALRKGMECEQTDSVYLCPDFESTGYHVFRDKSFRDFIARYFSRKSAANPFYWSAFVLLAVPRPWVLPNLTRVWYRVAKTMARQVLVASAKSGEDRS